MAHTGATRAHVQAIRAQDGLPALRCARHAVLGPPQSSQRSQSHRDNTSRDHHGGGFGQLRAKATAEGTAMSTGCLPALPSGLPRAALQQIRGGGAAHVVSAHVGEAADAIENALASDDHSSASRSERPDPELTAEQTYYARPRPPGKGAGSTHEYSSRAPIHYPSTHMSQVTT